MLELRKKMKDPEEIAEIYEALLRAYGSDFERMRVMRTLMNNEMPVPLPELSRDEQNTVANLALNGMDQLARRMASVDPTTYWPNTNPGIEKSKWRAANKPRVINGWHEANNMRIKRGKRGRFFLAYATSPVMIRPDNSMGMPKWHVANPLDTLLPPASFDDYLPKFAIFINTYTWRDLLATFNNDLVKQINRPDDWDWDNDYNNADREFTVLEYNDENEYSMILLGHQKIESFSRGYVEYHRAPAVRLTYAENLIGRPLVICPGRITLDSQIGHFDGIVGMYQVQAALMAMTVIGQRRALWPQQWLQGFPNAAGEPEIITYPDPYKGIPGEIRDGTIETVQLDPSFRSLEILDRQEEGIRKEAGIPAEFGGMSSTNIRTGRRGAQVMQSTIDFTIAEAQDCFAASLKEENKLAIAIDKGYFNRRKVFHIESRSYVGKVDYSPSDLWDTDSHVVDYPFAGVDLQNLVIEGIQRVASGTMSRETFMEMDPAIRDVPAEIQRLHRMGIQDAFLIGAKTLAANPEGPMQLPHLARLDKKLSEGKELYEAFIELQQEVQKEQAEVAPTPAQAQPGMAMPGQGVEQPEELPPVDESMNRMTQLLGSMATTQTAQQYRR